MGDIFFFVKHWRKHFVFFFDHKTPHPYGATTYLNNVEGRYYNIFSLVSRRLGESS
jgi:hypothetical protein